ncbi:hypothetical protein BACCAP_03455 [Pseudoflavonifractor capillosus ATCC 29799]|uniref:Uncharacterized protein n=1 Tax=Pseudoflavonifractor capillosus ATCC 29799 TaxID=411467 RepID=A6NZ04_9FIRM|nr:hypothetical protein BACCAP_03455 [Pseudoflavonifractor capillosus ATCC 29799]
MGLVKVQKERADRLRSPMSCLYALYIGDGGQISANPVPFDEFFEQCHFQQQKDTIYR